MNVSDEPQASGLAGALSSALSSALAPHADHLASIAAELPAAVGVEPTTAVLEEAQGLVRAYVADRALIEATELVDAQGDRDRGVAPFRDSLVYSLALVVAGRMLDASGVPQGRPVDAKPEALIASLERAYRLVAS
jgi:hypothetical protein